MLAPYSTEGASSALSFSSKLVGLAAGIVGGADLVIVPALGDVLVDGRGVLAEVGQVFGGVVAGFGVEVAEGRHDLCAHPFRPALVVGVAPVGVAVVAGVRDEAAGGGVADVGAHHRLAQARVQILIAPAEAQEPGLMVDPGGQEGHLVVGHIEMAGQHPRRTLDAVAEADVLDPEAVEQPAVHRHRVGVVDQDGIRAEGVHVGRDRLVGRGGAEETHDAARPERIPDRLIQAVLPGNLDIQPVRLQPTDLEGDDDVVGPVERPLAVVGRLDDGRKAVVPHQRPRRRAGPLGRGEVDVH